MLNLSTGVDAPIFFYHDGVVYRTGFKQCVVVRALGGAVDLSTWLHSLGGLLSRQLDIDDFEINASDVGSGYMMITVQTPQVAVDRRARGARGNARSVPLTAERKTTFYCKLP